MRNELEDLRRGVRHPAAGRAGRQDPTGRDHHDRRVQELGVGVPGRSLALVCVTLVGALFGQAITRVVPVNILHYVAGGLFIVMGVLAILGKL